MEIDLLRFLSAEDAILNIRGKNKKAIISALLEHLIAVGKIDKKNKREISRVIVQREEIGSTAIGGGIAFPHARLDCVRDVVLCLATSQDGVDFASLDEEPVHIIILLLSNQKEAGLHLKTLAFLAKLLRDKFFVEQLTEAATAEEIIKLIARQQKVLR